MRKLFLYMAVAYAGICLDLLDLLPQIWLRHPLGGAYMAALSSN